MKFTFNTADNKRVVCDTESDTQIYDAPNNPPNTGTRYTRGTDLYAHNAKSGQVYFYAYHWSMWQGEESSAELWSDSQVEAFIVGRMSGPYHERPSDSDIERLADLGINILDETA